MTYIDRTADNVIGSLNLALTTLKQARQAMLESNDADWSEDTRIISGAISAVSNTLTRAEVMADVARKARRA